jgi:hypothetical protein
MASPMAFLVSMKFLPIPLLMTLNIAGSRTISSTSWLRSPWSPLFLYGGRKSLPPASNTYRLPILKKKIIPPRAASNGEIPSSHRSIRISSSR